MHIEAYYSAALRSGRLDGKGGLSAQSVKHHHRVLSGALARAVKWRILVRNPAQAVEPPQPKKREMRALDADEISTLLRAAEGGRLYLPILVAISTGLRRGELLGLKWADIIEDRLSVRRSIEQTGVEGTKFKLPKTSKGARTVALPSSVVNALHKHETEQKKLRLFMGPTYSDSDLVFAEPDGTVWKPDSFTAAFRALAATLELGHFRFHDLRHSHATQLLVKGVHPKIVSERLGHSTIGITLDTYSHVLPGMQEEAAAKVDFLLRSSLAPKSV